VPQVRAPVSRFSTIQMQHLLGAVALDRHDGAGAGPFGEMLEVYRATTHLLRMPRLLGHGQHRIDYRHVIWSLVPVSLALSAAA
jgi:hypothetical protein